jgi:uncharacterized small protein (DUF1192 family)
MTDKVEKEAAEAKAQEEKPIDKMTAPELREIAKEIPGVTGVHAMKKAELLAVVKEARGIEDEAPKKKRVKAAKKVYTVKELKGKIAVLKEEKKKARGAKDGRKVDELRRRISRMKKLSRKVAQA